MGDRRLSCQLVLLPSMEMERPARGKQEEGKRCF
jgi:hypothetical protein